MFRGGREICAPFFRFRRRKKRDATRRVRCARQTHVISACRKNIRDPRETRDIKQSPSLSFHRDHESRGAFSRTRGRFPCLRANFRLYLLVYVSQSPGAKSEWRISRGLIAGRGFLSPGVAVYGGVFTVGVIHRHLSRGGKI